MTRKEYMKKWQQDNKEKTRENAKRYYYKNIDKIKEKRQSNEYKEKYREYKREWARKNRKTQKEVINKLQSNWNSLREWLENLIDNFQEDVSTPILHEQMAIRLVYEYMENLDKMNELEGVDNEKI